MADRRVDKVVPDGADMVDQLQKIFTDLFRYRWRHAAFLCVYRNISRLERTVKRGSVN